MSTLAVRNNNPGNLRDPRTGEFRKFNSPQEGYEALKQDLNIKMSGQSQTGVTPQSSLEHFASVYAPASDNNDPVGYARNLSSTLGVPSTTPIANLTGRIDDFAKAIAKNEDANMYAMLTGGGANRLSREQITANINALEQQGASQEDVQSYLDSLKTQTPPAGGTYAAPPQPKPFEPAAPPVPEEEKGMGRKAAEFLFPILEDKERTGLQTAADLGLSALTVIPGAGALGLGAKAALSGGVKGVLKGLVPKIMSKSTVAKGTGVGYGYDVLSNLSEGDTGAEALTPGIGTITGAGAPLVARGFKGTKGVQRVLDDEAMKEASDLVSPVLTKKNVKEGLKKGLATKTPGIRGDIGMDLDIRKQRAAESIKDLLKTGALKSSDTVEKKVGVIRAEIADTAEELEQQLKDMDIVPIVQPDELQNLLKKTEDIFEESPALVGDAGLSAKRIYNKFVSFIPKGQDVTALDLLRARKKLDQWVASEGRVGAFDPKLETAISKGLREIRQGANELLAEKAPNVQVQDMLRKQSSMYDALDGIVENEWKDVGTTRAGRYFKRHPYQKDVVRGVLTAAGTGVVGGTVAGQFLGDKATN